MTSATTTPARGGTLDDFLPAADIAPVPPLTDADWDAIRRVAGRRLVWQFCTLRNLWTHRGDFTADAFGYAWGGIFRSLLVGSIVTTSYRNEGHFRSGERIEGTADFFYGAFVFPKSSAGFREIVDVVNLRHHVAGVVQPDGAGGVRVVAGYEADYAYVATAFIESIRRGLEVCGLPAASRRGRDLGERICGILYQVAGLTGLTRMPRDLAAHERFRDAYDRRLRERPPSPRVHRMAQEIAGRIVPLTALKSGATVRDHVRRHFDAETAAFLFPGGEIPEELERRREEWRRRLVKEPTRAAVRRRSDTRLAIWQRPDVAALHRAYHEAVHVNADDSLDDRLIGAILLHAIDAGRESARPFEWRTVELAAGEPLIRQGARMDEMYVVLSATAPLDVFHQADGAADPHQVATLAAPTVLGEIGMWRGKPAVATVRSRGPNRLEMVVIDAGHFAALRNESGFRAATAAEVQRRLALNAALVGTLLDDAVARTGDPRLASITQLFRYLTGDSHVALDKVIDLVDSATPAECVEALRAQVDDLARSGNLPPDLERYLANVVATIG